MVQAMQNAEKLQTLVPWCESRRTDDVNGTDDCMQSRIREEG